MQLNKDFTAKTKNKQIGVTDTITRFGSAP